MAWRAKAEVQQQDPVEVNRVEVNKVEVQE